MASGKRVVKELGAGMEGTARRVPHLILILSGLPPGLGPPLHLQYVPVAGKEVGKSLVIFVL